MYIEQLYTQCLAEAAYYIESDGEAVIIDPLRETEPYIALAKKRGATIKYIFETHFHADFVSGHIDLAAKTGAVIVYGPTAQTVFYSLVAEDEELFTIGDAKLKVLHTPGHTMESACYLLYDESGKEHAVFTGDTLFVGDVGRPDLAIKSDLTQEDLAGMLYDSLNKKIKPLADDVIVYPAHGAGSACGKNIGKETFSTIGVQKKTNYALQPMTRKEFVAAVTEGLAEPPGYFAMDAMLNKQGYENIEQILSKNTNPLSVEEFEKAIGEGMLILDTRNADEFERGSIKDALNIGLNGQYAPWVGALLDVNQPLLLITDEGKETEAVLRLARVGYEKVHGFLKGGMEAWQKAGKVVSYMDSITAKEFSKNIAQKKIIDVRNASEWKNGVIEQAQLISLNDLQKQLSFLNKNEHYYIHCAGGYRSMMAASLMKKSGFNQVTNVKGGIAKIQEEQIALVEPVIEQ
ncbi:MAG TPA: MBL fold metallo-hydrolase [Bacteroidia bacterium]|nr:MBL fold metallo-hydrolase [Bacteroidia bacterium]